MFGFINFYSYICKLTKTKYMLHSNFEDPSIVELAEKDYPETTTEYKRIMYEQYELFCRKQSNYGPGNISVGTECRSDADVKLSLTGLWFRIIGAQDNVGESLTDTYQDLSVYGIIAQIVQNKKWGK